jgi:predicted dehydrogenase
MTKVRVGLVGTGFAAELHMYAYNRVYGVDAEVVAAVSRNDQVEAFAKKHQITQTYRDYRALLADPAIDVVDICTPPALHAQMMVDAVRAGKHVICEKPITGYFGRPGDPAPIGKHVRKKAMYEHVMAETKELRAAIENSGKLFMYAEDWVYAPALAKTVEILNATGDKILFMKAEESHSGSHAAHAAQWSMTGGGSLIRMGCHPPAAVLYLKRVEARARGEVIGVRDVTADVGNVAACLAPSERPFIKANPVDVEDWGMMTLTFTDGTKAVVLSSDMIMGGVRNLIETYTNSGSLFANITPNNQMTTTKPGSAASISPRRWTARPAGNSFAWKRNGPAATCRRFRISWNASRPAGSRWRIWSSPAKPPASNTRHIGRRRKDGASRCDARRVGRPPRAR